MWRRRISFIESADCCYCIQKCKKIFVQTVSRQSHRSGEWTRMLTFEPRDVSKNLSSWMEAFTNNFWVHTLHFWLLTFKTVFYILEIRNATLIRMLALTTVYVNSSREWPVINSIWRLEAWYNIHVMATINELNGDGKISVWWWNQIWLKCKV